MKIVHKKKMTAIIEIIYIHVNMMTNLKTFDKFTKASFV
jgi:hypothetical protein